MGMIYEAMQAGGWKPPLPSVAGGVLAVGQSVGQAYDGVKAWQEGDRVKASVRFTGAAAPVLVFFGPVGVGLSVGIGIGTLCYDHRDKIRQFLNS
jgi:hypothetical protein